MRVVLAGLLVLVCHGCGGQDQDGERFEIYHLELAIGSPGDKGDLHCGPPRPVCPGVVEQPPPRAAFAQVTRRAARLGARDQGWHHVAIVVGEEIVAFPHIDFDAYPDGFTEAPARATRADARELVRRLRGD